MQMPEIHPHQASSNRGGFFDVRVLQVRDKRNCCGPSADSCSSNTIDMISNLLLGVALHAIGGLMSAIFYQPYRKVKHWS